MIFLKKFRIASIYVLCLTVLVNSQADELTPDALVSYIQPNMDTSFLSYSQRINLVKVYIDQNAGEAALAILKPLMRGTPQYQVMLLAAQCYAELNRPLDALHFYELAEELGRTTTEKSLANNGISRMHTWLSKNQREAVVLKPTVLTSIVIPTPMLYKREHQPPFAHRIDRARHYLTLNKGKRALKSLKPLLTKQSNFTIRILAAQGYAEINQPQMALSYYKSAYRIAQNVQEKTIALFGIGKMEFWLGNYYPAMDSYQHILSLGPHRGDFELAKAGLIKSLAYADRPRLGYHAIPRDLVFTTPEMVIAASQATLWADQADLTKEILTNYQGIIQTISPKSALACDLQDLQWQVALNTNPNVLTPSVFYSEDSVHFSVLRSILDETHYWSQQHQSSIGIEQVRYKQIHSLLNAEGLYLKEKWRPTRELILSGKLEPTTYQLWNPFLWAVNATYRPNDRIGAQILAQAEVVETFPAFDHHITDNQYAGSLALSPLPYIKLNGSLSRLDLSDTNVRNGYFIAGTAVLSTVWGLNVTLQKRGYTDKFVSRYYFSPNQYSAESVILRLGRKTNTVWHYYIDGGIGTQHIGITGNPVATSPIDQWGFGLTGPINRYLVLNAYYMMSHQASAFLDSPKYTYQSGGVSLNILL